MFTAFKTHSANSRPFLATIVLPLALVLMSHVAVAQDQDVAGAQDHQLFARYSGSVIIGYDYKGLDEFALPVGPVFLNARPKRQHLEGKVTRILYLGAPGQSSLEVFRHYELASKKLAGLKVLFECSRDQCGEWNGAALPQSLLSNRELRNSVVAAQAFGGYPADIRYLSASAPTENGEVYLSLAVGLQSHDREQAGRVLTLLEVIETKAPSR